MHYYVRLEFVVEGILAMADVPEIKVVLINNPRTNGRGHVGHTRPNSH